jgi:thiol-disulfide isomerase/thioredoxin
MSRKGRRPGSKRNNRLYVFLALVVLVAVFAYFIFTQAGSATACPLCNTPASPTVLSELAGVSTSTLNAVGTGPSGDVAPPKAISPAAPSKLTLNGKPEVLYMGAEFCPYCGAERWAMIVALDKFGTFTGIQYMESSGTDVFASTPTFTFVNANYTSKYIAFVTIEQEDRNENPLQTATAQETSLLTTYDSSGGIPFIDFGNVYTIVSSSYTPGALRVDQNEQSPAYNWTQIASQLNNASSVFAQNIDATANYMISATCKIDGGAPSNICSESFADLTLSYVGTSTPGSSQLLASDSVLGVSPYPESPRISLGRPVLRI